MQRLANKFNVGQTHFREIVHSNFIMSPQQLIETIRLEEGSKLVSNGVKIYEVAIKVGYSHTKSFRRAFKRRFGFSPNQFKQKLKNIYYKDANMSKSIRKQLWGKNIRTGDNVR